MSTLSEKFNHTGISRFINSPAGRAFRLAAGVAFLGIGYLFRAHALGVAAMAWSIVPLSAGAFNLCYVSALLGGPIKSTTIRERTEQPPAHPSLAA